VLVEVFCIRRRAIFVGIHRGLVAIKDVVGLLGAIGGLECGLHLEGVPKRAQDGPDQVFLVPGGASDQALRGN
jgi:hypothetical protein